MLIDIGKIVINERLRKDCGDVQELADNISENGLILPIVIDDNYTLIAGERRLAACKALGWSHIDAKMMNVRDSEHKLRLEISENIRRKDFTKSERLDCARRLARVFSAKGKENQRIGGHGLTVEKPVNTRDEVARLLGISGSTLRNEMFIFDNQDLLTEQEFDDWNSGRLSTNAAYNLVTNARREDVNTASVDAKWTTDKIRSLMKIPKSTHRNPCFICGKHKPITEMHHVVHVSELTSLLNKGLIDISDVSTPVVWLCPNCHAYVHAILRGDAEAVDKVTADPDWMRRYHELSRHRDARIKEIIDKCRDEVDDEC